MTVGLNFFPFEIVSYYIIMIIKMHIFEIQTYAHIYIYGPVYKFVYIHICVCLSFNLALDLDIYLDIDIYLLYTYSDLGIRR